MTLSADPVPSRPTDPEDVPSNPSASRPFTEIAEARLSRRTVLAGGMFAAAGFLTAGLAGAPPAAAGPSRAAGRGRPLLGFAAVPPSGADAVLVPPGYSADVFIPWGTPLFGNTPVFVPGSPDAGVPGGNTSAEQAEQIGMHHDGMAYFPLPQGPRGKERGVLVLNHEYTDDNYLHTGTSTFPPREAYTLEMVRKAQAAHGVSVVEIERTPSRRWRVVTSSPRNRRITANTPMSFSGPAAGHRLLRTKADRDGSTPLGTFNNCGNGETPWGTYLTCEENFNGYFIPRPGQKPEAAGLQERYGVAEFGVAWAVADPRFVVTPGDPNEPNRHGWVVEIDPMQPHSTPVKRTALGRIKHEDASVHVTTGGRVVVYMGDDQQFEYVYKFVSADDWESMRARGRSPLDEGTLYVARFAEDGTGEWLPLVHGQGPLTAAYGFADQGEVLVKTRLAADALGATPMDRPEWTAVDPRTGTVYVTLTNNTSRTTADAANPRAANRWGHIVRWDEAGGDHAATEFRWDVFLLAGPGGGVDGSTVDAEDAFGSPDGLAFDPDGRAWIQTDGTQPGGFNNQMLAADPTRTDAQGRPEIRRFLTGPVGCEVTGAALTPDRRTLFVNIQHPGERGGSTWPPGDGLDTPRSATVVITKDDGGVIGT